MKWLRNSYSKFVNLFYLRVLMLMIEKLSIDSSTLKICILTQIWKKNVFQSFILYFFTSFKECDLDPIVGECGLVGGKYQNNNYGPLKKYKW